MHSNCPYHLLHIKPALTPLIAEWRAVWHLELSFLSVAAWRRGWSASTSSFLTVLRIKISEMTIMLHSIRLETINSLVKCLLRLEIKETKLLFSHRLQYSHTSFYNQRSRPLLTVKKNAGSRHLYVSIRYIYVSLAKACCWSGVGDLASYQNIPRTEGCPCRTASSWSGVPAHLQGGPWERCPENRERNIRWLWLGEKPQRGNEHLHHSEEAYVWPVPL